MTDHRKPKRFKNLFSFLSPLVVSSSDNVDEVEAEIGSVSVSRLVTDNSVNDIGLNFSPSIPLEERSESFDMNSLQRDLGLQQPISSHAMDMCDRIRKAYVVLGPYQPCSSFYPLSFDGGQAFTVDGFNGWKNVSSKKSGMIFHMGGINSPYSIAMHQWESLRNPSHHIEQLISAQSSQEIADNRLRLITSIESVRLLVHQGCTFRGHDESANSSNCGNFDAVVNSFGRVSLEVSRVTKNAHGNAKYTAPSIQKEIVNILGNNVRKNIRDEVGVGKFCIFVDEATFNFKSIRKEESVELVAVGTLKTGLGLNQSSTLQRARATRWGSHLRSISSLIKLFGVTRTTCRNLIIRGPNKVQDEECGICKALKRFDFVICLHLMYDVMMITDFLCQSLQKKSIDILNTLRFLSLTKSKLQDMRDNGWDALIMKVTSFCCEYDILIPYMSASYKKDMRACKQDITIEQFYRVNVFYVVIDFQLAELNSRFLDESVELLVLSTTFDPHDNFQSFRSEDVHNLALRFYPADFTSYELFALDMKCGYFLADIQMDSRFANITSVSDLCRRLVESRKSALFPMIYRLICLVLTKPVSTTTTERAFSSMNIIKNKLRNRMEDEFLDDLMVFYTEKELTNSIDNDSVITEFELSGSHMVRFR
ncbi:uncharacterized protein LOC126783978 [Argentina anserina]|uniref:uncharacterized protein LOC126783978 n=1 Tax=Argentina anserina TaxID=57926 RepID=UPI0021763086|nr:uncharacterized protein LOC126783978 [Potentilla anserina]